MNKNIVLTAFSAVTLAASPLAISADSSEDQIETIITTATRTPKPISEVLSVSTVITREDIELFQARDVVDLLSREAGVSLVRNGGRGSATSLLLRGNQSDHTLFLVDGIRIGSATLGSANLSMLNMNLVERIEIIRGPKSALYGADAIGGVVNIITRTSASPTGENPMAVDLSYGSNNTRELNAVGSVQGERFSLAAVVSSFDTEGVDITSDTSGVNGDSDGSDNKSLSLNYGLALTPDLDIRLSYSRSQGESDYDAACGDATTYAPVECQIYSDSLVDTLAASIDYAVSTKFRTRLQFGQSDDESEQLARNIDISTTYNAGIFNTTKREATWLNFLDLTSSELLTAGLDYSRDQVESSTNYDVDSRTNQAAFVQLESRRDALSFTLGARYDDNEQFGSKATKSIQAGYQLSDNLRLVGSYAEGFKAPTFNDLYYPYYGNPGFVPEESINYEIALQGEQGAASFYAAFYQNDVENLIQYDSTSFETNQVAKASISGFEFNIDVFLERWQLGLAGNVIDAENKATGNTLRRRPEQMLSLDADSRFQKFSYGASVRMENHRFDDAANNIRLGGYTLFDIRGALELSQEWQLEAQVNNLFDKRYTTALDFSLGEYQPVGREVFVSVSYRPTF